MKIRLGWCIFLAVVFSFRIVQAEVPPVRLAVIGDAGGQDLASLVAVELSHDKTITLVERDDLAKAGDELELKRRAGGDAVALGKLLGADGLVFLSKGPAGTQVRLTAVRLGGVLFDDRYAAPADPTQLARSVAHRVVDYAPKLKLDPTHVIPVSLLNLRADIATADSTALERKLTLLLESCLAAFPEYVVLERRHAGTLRFERSLDPAGGELLRGAYVIDGTLETPAREGLDTNVRLRIRTPDGRQIDRAGHGPAGDLPALAGKLADEIGLATGGSGVPLAADARHEADEYLQEGLWGWRHAANEEALEALDSAELFGANPADVVAARIDVLSALADRGMEHWDPKVSPYPPKVSRGVLASNIDPALRVLRDAVHYRDDKLDTQLRALVADEPWRARDFTAHRQAEKAIYAASKLLLFLDETGSPRADELREALRPTTGYDPLHGKAAHGFGTWANAGDCSEVFADQWARRMEEEWAYCRLASADTAYHPFALELAGGMRGRGDWTFCARFAPERAEQVKLFRRFAQTLQDDLTTRLTSLLLQTILGDQTTADAAFQAYFDDLWKRREELVVPRFSPEWVSARAIPSEVFNRNYRATLPLLHDDLTRAGSLRFNKNALVLLWRPENWTPEEAFALWKDYAGFKERATRDWVGTHPHGAPNFSDYEKPFLEKFPQLSGPLSKPFAGSPVRPALAVTHFWHPWLSTTWPYDCFHFALMASDDGGVWLEGFNPGQEETLFRVGLPDFTTQIIAIPERRQVQTLVSARGAIFATWETHGHDNTGEGAHQIARYDLATAQWETHHLPDYSTCQLCDLDGSLYLFLQSRVPAYESAVIRYDWDQDKSVVLASTRRRPAQNQFDDRRNLLDAAIFLGPRRQPCVCSLEEGTFYIQEKPGLWPKVFDGGYDHRTVSALSKTLVVDQSGRITLLDPDREAPELLLAPAGDDRAVWDLPKDGKLYYGRVCLHGDCLFILEDPKEKSGNVDLICYQRGKGRNARHVPLEFRLDDETRTRLSTKPEHAPWDWSFGQIEHPDSSTVAGHFSWFYATKQGLFLKSDNVGFWFLPYADIDAYLKGSHD